MEAGSWKILLAAIALIQLTRAEVTIETPESGQLLQFYGGILNVFKADYPLEDNETNVVYSRNVAQENIFAYATHNSARKFAVIRVVALKESRDFIFDRKCEFDFDVPDSSIIILDTLTHWTSGSTFTVTFTWHLEGHETDLHTDKVDSTTCHDAEWNRQLKEDKDKDFKFSAEEVAEPTANGTEAADLAKLKIPEGYSFVDKVNAGGSTVRIMYANQTSGRVSLASKNNRPPVDGLWVESLAMDRYGACWEKDMKLTCGQARKEAINKPWELKEWASLPLPMYHDWLGVINYADNRMLLIMGDMGGTCTPDKNCDYFLLYEMRPNGKIYRHSGAHILLGGCNNPKELTIDSYNRNNGTCFNMACVGLSDNKRTLKFRQTCAVLG